MSKHRKITGFSPSTRKSDAVPDSGLRFLCSFPAKYTATAKFTSFFEMGRELSLSATKITYEK